MASWNGLMAKAKRGEAEVTIIAPLRQGSQGSSGAFLALGDDGRRYWVKSINNAQSDRVPITEQIVGRMGALISAATCEVRIAKIPEEIGGWEFRSGLTLGPGLAHASLDVENAILYGQLSHRDKDDNARRHLSVMALYDWCWGDDPQWIVALGDDHRYYSHDHGCYLPPGGLGWSIDELRKCANVPHELLPGDNSGISRSMVEELAGRLQRVTRDEIFNGLCAIPSEWPATDQELEAVGEFLEMRAAEVSERLLRRFGVFSSGTKVDP